MRHVFKATKMGWGKEKEGIYFDAKYYTKEEAMAEFKPFQGTTQKDTHIQVMNMTDKNITMLLMLASLKITTCRTLISS